MGLARAIADFIASGVRFVKLMSNSLQAVTSADDILPRRSVLLPSIEVAGARDELLDG